MKINFVYLVIYHNYLALLLIFPSSLKLSRNMFYIPTTATKIFKSRVKRAYASFVFFLQKKVIIQLKLIC